MKGNNEMTINEATMRIIVQHYFDTLLFAAGKSPDVASVKVRSSGDGMFTVRLSESPEVPA